MSKKIASNVIALCHQGDHFQAVECHRHGDRIEVKHFWQTEGPRDQWETFAQTCGIALAPSSGGLRPEQRGVIVGLDSMGLLFSQLEVPEVGPAETEAMIRMQLETRLPLELEQMQWAWRNQSSGPDMVTVLVAATRKRSLQQRQQSWASLQPDRILLCAEALVQVWRDVFEIQRDAGIVVSINTTDTDVCVARQGHLVHAAVLDVGAVDLAEGGHEAMERLIRDLQRVLSGIAEELPVTILSDGSPRWDDLAEILRQSGFKARAVMPDERRLMLADDVTPAVLYQGRVALGLALLAWDQNAKPVQLMKSMLLSEPEKESGRSRISLTTAVILLVLAAMLWGATTVGTLTWRKHRLEPLVSDPNVTTWLAEHAARKSTALYRPDLLALLKTLNEVEADRIVLDDLVFKRGQPVKITGQAKKTDSLYRFEEDLNACKDIKNAVIEKHDKEEKGKKITFTLTFDYKNVTQKSAGN